MPREAARHVLTEWHGNEKIPLPARRCLHTYEALNCTMPGVPPHPVLQMPGQLLLAVLLLPWPSPQGHMGYNKS